MKLIEVAPNKFIDLDKLCSVEVFTREKIIQKPLHDFGEKDRPRKIGETFTLRITTSDGSHHDVDETFSPSIYDAIFPLTPK